jgi:2-methylcitrate dehydratase PrpD
LLEERTVANGIAEWVHAVRFEDLPGHVQAEARKSLINTVGTSIGAFTLPDVQHTLAYALAEESTGPSTVFVDGSKLPPSTAAFVNGVMANHLGQEETHLISGTHPAETTTPAVLTYAERYGSSGRDVLEAIVVGIEVTVAVARMKLTPPVKYDNCEGPAVYGTIGGAAAVAKLAGLDEQGIAHAIGISANFAAGLSECFQRGTDDYHYSVGLASQHAYMAAILAAQGAAVASTSLEGRGGFYQLFGAASREDLAAYDVYGDVLGRLGQEWAIPELIYKPYPVNFFNQVFIDGARRLREEHDLKPEQVRSVRIELGTLAAGAGATLKPPFTTRGKVLSSTSFGIASMLTRGTLNLADTLDLDAPDILPLVARTEVIADPGLATSRIQITTDDGTFSFDGETEGMDLRLPEDQIVEIARGAASSVLPADRVDRLMAVMESIGDADDVSELMELTTAPKEARR